jgi:hypothetical protein
VKERLGYKKAQIGPFFVLSFAPGFQSGLPASPFLPLSPIGGSSWGSWPGCEKGLITFPHWLSWWKEAGKQIALKPSLVRTFVFANSPLILDIENVLPYH